MFILSTVLIIVASIVLILIVLVQNSKGGGLSSSFGGANQFGGVVQTNKFLEKATWMLALAVLIFSIAASVTIENRGQKEQKSSIQEFLSGEADYASEVNPLSQEEIDAQKKEMEKGKTETTGEETKKEEKK